MPTMVMDCKVDNADVLKKLQAGDRITARVCEKASPATAPKK